MDICNIPSNKAHASIYLNGAFDALTELLNSVDDEAAVSEIKTQLQFIASLDYELEAKIDNLTGGQ